MPESPYKRLTPDQFRDCLKAAGWTVESLAARWEITTRRCFQIVADTNRNRYYDDALAALPIRTCPYTLLDDMTEDELTVLKRLRKKPISGTVSANGWRPLRSQKDVLVGVYDKLLARNPPLVKLLDNDLHLVDLK